MLFGVSVRSGADAVCARSGGLMSPLQRGALWHLASAVLWRLASAVVCDDWQVYFVRGGRMAHIVLRAWRVAHGCVCARVTSGRRVRSCVRGVLRTVRCGRRARRNRVRRAAG